jgi:hypothetical protein
VPNSLPKLKSIMPSTELNPQAEQAKDLHHHRLNELAIAADFTQTILAHSFGADLFPKVTSEMAPLATQSAEVASYEAQMNASQPSVTEQFAGSTPQPILTERQLFENQARQQVTEAHGELV